MKKNTETNRKENINKIIMDIFFFIILIIIIGFNILPKQLGDLDEIWNYNFANCISKGLIPYRDFNIVQTPLLPIISGIILKLTTNQLIVMRILAIILSTSILFVIYKILDKLKIKKSINIISIIIIFELLKNYFCIDYNFFSLFLTLIILYLELNKKEQSKKYNILIGVLGALVVLTKQTIGLFVCLSIIGYKIIFLIKSKENIKQEIINILFRILGISIIGILFILYLAINNAFIDFWNYAILGIKTFSNKISYMNLIKSDAFVIKYLSVFVPISFIIEFIYSVIKKDKNMFIILCLSLSMFVVAFPISDNIHFLIGSTISFIGIILIFNNIIVDEKNLSKINLFYIYFLEYFSYFLLFYALLVEGYKFYEENKNIEYRSNLNHFKNIPISEDFENTINKIDNYILNSDKKVYILNFDAAIYMIPINRYNKDYDMFLKGNIGKDGEQGKIEDIINEDSKYLIVNDKIKRNWQNPEDVRKYIKSNLILTEEIENYEVYENK